MSSLEQQLNETITVGNTRNVNNGSVWTFWIDKIVFQQLSAGTTPSAIPENVEIDTQALAKNAEIEEIPSASHDRTCRWKIRIIGEASAALRLA